MALIGYARVSTLEQEAALQLDALEAAGCERIYTDRSAKRIVCQSRPVPVRERWLPEVFSSQSSPRRSPSRRSDRTWTRYFG